MIENIKARIYAKRYDVYAKQKVSHHTGYYIYDKTIYVGNRSLVFMKSQYNKK